MAKTENGGSKRKPAATTDARGKAKKRAEAELTEDELKKVSGGGDGKNWIAS